MYNSNNVNMLSIARGPRYIHHDLHSRPTINSKADLKEMYPECFGGGGMFKDFEYEIKVNSKAKPVVHTFEFEFINICIVQNVQTYLNALYSNKTC